MSKAEIIIQMRQVSDAMIALGEEMKKCDNSNFRNHGTELSGAGLILANWQAAAENEENSR